MADENKALLYGGLALVGLGGVMLLQKKPAVPTAPPPGPPPPSPLPPPSPGPTGPANFVTLGGVTVRLGNSNSYPAVGYLARGTPIYVICQLTGQQIGSSTIWDRVLSPLNGYVPDWWVSTPQVGRFTPGISVCSGSGTPPPNPSSLPSTGGGAVSDPRLVPAGWIVSTSCQYGTADYLIEPAGIGLDFFPYGFEPLHKRKRWITDQMTWNKLGVPRSAIHLVTPGLLNAIKDGPALRWLPARGEGFIWDNGGPRIAPNSANAGNGC